MGVALKPEQPERLNDRYFRSSNAWRASSRRCYWNPGPLSHPHALRTYWATHCLEAGVSVHEVSARLGHVDLRTTARYAAHA